MNDRVEQKQRIKSYLLRQMTADERAEFERQYSADGELFDLVVAAEDEMIGAYLRGEGTEQERSEFASQFLKTASGNEKVEFAKTWMDYISSPDRTKPGRGNIARSRVTRGFPWWPVKFGIAAAWILVVGAVIWLAVVNIHLRREQVRILNEQQNLQHQNDQIKDELNSTVSKLQQEQERETELQGQIAQLGNANSEQLFVLSAGTARGAGGQEPLQIARRTRQIHLQINLQYDDYPSYNVSLGTAEGNPILRRENLKSRIVGRGQPAIAVNLLASQLQNRTYVLTIIGIASDGARKSVGDYSFRATRQ